MFPIDGTYDAAAQRQIAQLIALRSAQARPMVLPVLRRPGTAGAQARLDRAAFVALGDPCAEWADGEVQMVLDSIWVRDESGEAHPPR